MKKPIATVWATAAAVILALATPAEAQTPMAYHSEVPPVEGTFLCDGKNLVNGNYTLGWEPSIKTTISRTGDTINANVDMRGYKGELAGLAPAIAPTVADYMQTAIEISSAACNRPGVSVSYPDKPIKDIHFLITLLDQPQLAAPQPSAVSLTSSSPMPK